MATLTKIEAGRLMASGYAVNGLQAEILEELMQTNYYSGAFKNKINGLQKEILKREELILSAFGNQDDPEGYEKDYMQFQRIIEKFVQVLKEKDLGLVLMFLDELLAGRVGYMDGKKHKKILNQIEKI